MSLINFFMDCISKINYYLEKLLKLNSINIGQIYKGLYRKTEDGNRLKCRYIK